MAANLVRAYSAEQAHRLLNRSFAQYQSDRDVVRLEARRERFQARLDEQRELAISPLGDIWEYRAERDADGGAATTSPAAARRRSRRCARGTW